MFGFVPVIWLIMISCKSSYCVLTCSIWSWLRTWERVCLDFGQMEFCQKPLPMNHKLELKSALFVPFFFLISQAVLFLEVIHSSCVTDCWQILFFFKFWFPTTFCFSLLSMILWRRMGTWWLQLERGIVCSCNARLQILWRDMRLLLEQIEMRFLEIILYCTENCIVWFSLRRKYRLTDGSFFLN